MSVNQTDRQAEKFCIFSKLVSKNVLTSLEKYAIIGKPCRGRAIQ